LLEAHKSGNRERFRAVALQAIAGLRSPEEREQTRKILSDIEDPDAFCLRALGHKDQAIVSQLPRVDLGSLHLDATVRATVAQLKLEREEFGKLLLHNLPQRSRVILHGPPGCGKTSLAAALATEFQMNGYVIRLSEIRDSLLGDTAKKLATAFRLVSDSRTLLLIDEIDVLANERTNDPSSASRENNATVATVLQLLDQIPQGIVVGATNRLDSIDPAAMRRFDLCLELSGPSESESVEFARRIFTRHDWPILDWMPRDTSSFAAIERDAMEHIRREVLR
jgi:SpoVK/Ycf46/Vps4 family AAA+-type ATPase